MATSYPSGLDTSWTNPSGAATLGAAGHSGLHGEERDAIKAIENVLGTTAGTSLLMNFAAGQFPEKKSVLTFGTSTVNLGTGNPAASNILTYNGTTASWAAPASTFGFWNDVPGTPTRVSDTQFTITDTSNANLYDLLFKKGVILKWLESTTINTAMVVSSSYGANAVTINIVGDSLTAGFTSMKYGVSMAQTLEFIVPGTLGTATDAARTHYASTDLIKISVDAYVKTAGTTNATDFDVNDDGSTIITTKPSIASGSTSDIDNVCDAPTTVIAQDSLITMDIDAVSTTAPVEAYLKLFVFPKSWLYRS